MLRKPYEDKITLGPNSPRINAKGAKDLHFKMKLYLLIRFVYADSHSSILAWKIPWMEEPGGLQSMGSLRVGHD